MLAAMAGDAHGFRVVLSLSLFCVFILGAACLFFYITLSRDL
jgi:hypothetical protein